MDQQLMTKMKIGCVGALTPILINLLIVDLQTTLSNLTLISALSYGLRVIGLCAAACIVVYLNSDEARPVKLFQLGIMAPALLTGMLNGVAANKQGASPAAVAQNAPAAPARTTETDTARHLAFVWPSFIGRAHAQGAALPGGAVNCSTPRDLTVKQQVLQGLIGIVPENQWYVVVGSSPTAESALADVSTLNHRFEGRFHATVCAPAGGSDNRYRVVIGSHMTYAEATKLKQEATAAGFAGDPWVWNPAQSSR